jgi:exodeoxyribonuclease-3
MKLISWNVNGLRACLGKGFSDSVQQLDADVICVQETKMQPGQATVGLDGFTEFWNSAEQRGYSGTAVFVKNSSLKSPRVDYGIGQKEHDREGRVITLRFKDWTLVTVYTPNSQDSLARLDYRMTWEDAFREYLQNLDKENPVVVCGDLNVAHQEIDLAHPKANRRNSGFTDEERGKFTELLAAGFADSFRMRYPDLVNAYTWWSYRANARVKNVGWRIDYFLISQRWVPRIKDALIYPDIFGSDHCPVGLVLE